AAVNTAFATALQVRVTARDANEPVAGGQVAFTAPSSGASASLSASPATIDGSAHASVTATANGTRGSYSVTASAGSSYSTTFSLTNGLSPVFSNLLSPSISYGTALTTLGGHLAAGSTVPPANETVSITIHGVTETAALDGSGDFSVAFPTA